MATTVVLVKVTKESQPSTRVLIQFSDGTGWEFANMADLTAWAQDPDKNIPLTQQMCMAYALARSSDLSNLAPVLNKNFIFDLSNNNPIRVQ